MMIPRGFVVCACLGVLLAMSGVGAAQDQSEPMDESLFWLLMQRTNATLIDALTGSADPTTLAEVHNAWLDVESVRLEDGTVVAVDTRWLTIEQDTTLEDLALMQARVEALLNYQASRGGLPPDSAAMLAELERLLQQRRFQYDEAEPPPPPPPSPNVNAPNTSGLAGILPTLGQLLLIVGGIILVVMLLFWLARSLNVQRVDLEKNVNGEDIPVSSDAASELAARSMASADYRAAIRYLYLSSLLLLDERGVIHFDPSLTNFEHLKLVEHQPHLLELLSPIVGIFDRVWYGFAPVDESHYQKFVQLVDRLRQVNA